MTPGAPFLPYLVKLGSPGLRRFLVRMTPWPLLQRLRQAVDIMAYNMLEIFQAQKGELNNSATDYEKGKDIMGILCMSESELFSLPSLILLYSESEQSLDRGGSPVRF